MTPAEQTQLSKAIREYVYQVHVYQAEPTRQQWRHVVSREEQLFTALRPCERAASMFEEEENH